MTDNNTYLAISPPDLITAQQKQLIMFVKLHVCHFVSCFLCELPLILGVTQKRKEQAEDICKGTPDIEFEQDWSIGLCAILADGQKILKTIFLVSGIFPGKIDSVMLWASNVL